MSAASLRALALAAMLVGGAAASVWVYAAGGPTALAILRDADPARALLMVAITAFCVVVRFVRWQFMLRCLRSIRPSHSKAETRSSVRPATRPATPWKGSPAF